MNKRNRTGRTQDAGSGMHCVGFHELMRWEIAQYRQAIKQYRSEMVKAGHRYISWSEAEKVLAAKDLQCMGEQWRIEYCGCICPQRNACLLAMHFLSARHPVPLCKAV